jgi:HEAT repeat protein
LDKVTISIARRLSGGNPRSLGDVAAVIEAVLDDPAQLEELFGCLFCDDPIVRMRAADGLEKIAGQRPELMIPYLERLLGDVATIEQPSIQWHLAQILAEVPLDRDQRQRAIKVLKRNLEHSEDWIVLTVTMESLARFATDDAKLRRWLVPVLRSWLADERKAVAKRAGKLLKGLELSARDSGGGTAT